MAIQQKKLASGFIRVVEYDPATQQLDLTFENKTVLAYKQVPEWVFRKLCNDPSPRAFWEDNIADEYSKGIPRKSSTADNANQQLKDLFGGQ